MDLFRYRRRKQLSLDGTVADMAISRYRPGYRAISAPIDLPQYGSQDYLRPLPGPYDPHPGFADFAEPEYEIYEPIMPHSMTPADLRPVASAPLPEEPEIQEYDAPLMNDMFFQIAMQDATATPDVTEVMPFDNPVMADDLMGGKEPLQDLEELASDPTLEAQAIFDEQMAMFEQHEMPEPDPFAMQQQMYDSQMQQFMDPWMMPDMEPGM